MLLDLIYDVSLAKLATFSVPEPIPGVYYTTDKNRSNFEMTLSFIGSLPDYEQKIKKIHFCIRKIIFLYSSVWKIYNFHAKTQFPCNKQILHFLFHEKKVDLIIRITIF